MNYVSHHYPDHYDDYEPPLRHSDGLIVWRWLNFYTQLPDHRLFDRLYSEGDLLPLSALLVVAAEEWEEEHLAAEDDLDFDGFVEQFLCFGNFPEAHGLLRSKVSDSSDLDSTVRELTSMRENLFSFIDGRRAEFISKLDYMALKTP